MEVLQISGWIIMLRKVVDERNLTSASFRSKEPFQHGTSN